MSGPASRPVRVHWLLAVVVAAGLAGCATHGVGGRPIAAPRWIDARVEAAARTPVATPIGGQVLRVLVRDGDYVAAGDALAVLDPAPFEAQIARAATQRDAAAAQWQRVYAGLDRQDARAFNPTYTVDRRFDAMRAEVLEAEIGAAIANVLARQADADRDATTLRAPVAGRVAGLVLATGATLATNDRVAAIDDDDEIVVVADWPVVALAAEQVAPGRRVSIAWPAGGRDAARPIAGRVLRVDAASGKDAATRRVRIGIAEAVWTPAGTRVQVRAD